MPNYTERFQLEQPLSSENYNIEVFNENAAKIDAALGAQADLLTARKEDLEGVQAGLLAHTGDRENPHGVTAQQAGADPAGTAESKSSAVQANLNAHTGNQSNPHGVTRAQIGAAAAVTYTCTIGTTWSGSGPYTQTVAVSGILAADNPIADLVLTGTKATDVARLEAWGLVGRITTAAGSITVTCYEEKPTVAMPIQLKVVR